MKTKLVSLTLLCLILFAGTGKSQPTTQIQQDRERYERSLRYYWDGGGGGYWDGGGRGAGASARTQELLRDPKFRAALGVSDEYYQKILGSGRNVSGHISEHPGFLEAEQEYSEALQAVTGNPHPIGLPALPDADEKAMKRFQEAAKRVESMHHEWGESAQQRRDVAFEDAITPELRLKIQEAHLAAMGETPTIVPHLFEALHLTDAQRRQMDRIKKELESEFEKHLGIYAHNASMILARVEAAIPQKNPQEDLKTFMRKLEEEPEHKKLLDESYTSGKTFAALFRTRMLEILTEEQQKRLQELVANPPLHARILIQRLRREHWGQHTESMGEGACADTGVGTEVWGPGPDSWRPGDPLPEIYRQEKDTGRTFPREEN